MTQTERLQWGHFFVRVRQAPQGLVWRIEDVSSGEASTFDSSYDMLAFIRAHLVEKEEDMSAASEQEAL